MSALNTHSKFYYGWLITAQNKFIDFNDGSNKSVELQAGAYTPTALATEIKKKMDAASSIDFTVSFNRSTRKFTISGTSAFNLLFATGSNSGQSASGVLGYSALDLLSLSSYTAQNASGSEYATQFILQSYKPTSINRKAVDGVINESSGGTIEVIKFGNKRFMECEFKFITDIIQEDGSIVRTNTNGVAEFVSFMEWATEKYPLEFMPNESDVSTYQEFILESTPSDSKGLDFDLIETYDKGLPYYYESGKLKFRLI